MSDLLSKGNKPNKKQTEKKDLRDRQVTISPPKNTYDPSKESTKPIKKSSKNRSATTTVRVTSDTQDKLRALTTLGKGESVDQVISIMIEEYLQILPEQEQNEYRLIQNVLNKKRQK